MPKVSVIIPNYNHARYLRQRVDSVLGQTYEDFEVILLDDCSTDESRTILSEYASNPRVMLEFNAENSGSTFKQWNKGVRLARGQYVWIAESDDYADAHLLEKLVSSLDAEPSAVLSYCRSLRISAGGELSGFLDSYLPDLGSQKWAGDFRADGVEECHNYLVYCNTVLSASSVLFRREVYLQVGGADENLVFCGDWKTWASMALTGGTISYIGEPLNYYRFHDASVTEKSQRNGVWASEALHVVGWILQRVTLDETARRKVGEHLAYHWPGAVLNRRIPFSFRWTILKNAMAIDSRALRKLVRPALTGLRLTLARRWRSLRGVSRASKTGLAAVDPGACRAQRNRESNQSKSCTVSVIIPCFNHGEFLLEAVGSVNNIKREDIEVIVVDDGSTDERTGKEMDALSAQGIKVIQQENRGLAAARNAGIAISRGEYILPLDADDRLRPGWIDKGIRILESNPQVGVVYGDAECFGTRTGRWRVGPFETDKLLKWNYIHASALYRRCVWEQNRGYDGTMPVQGLEDWDFWLGALEHGWEFSYMPEIFFEYRQAEQSMLTRTQGYHSEVEAFIATKHGLLYRQAWLRLEREHSSVKATSRNLGRLLKSRFKQKVQK